MPRVSDEHRAARKDQITDAALACFAERGFQRTSMSDIIAASGLSAGAIYLHFASKQEITLAVVRRLLARRTADLDARAAAGADLDPLDLVRVQMSGLAEDLTDARILVQVLGESTVDPDLQALVSEIFRTVAGALGRYLTAWAIADRHLSPADAAAWAGRILPALMSFGQGFLIQKALLPGFDPDAYFAAARELVATV